MNNSLATYNTVAMGSIADIVPAFGNVDQFGARAFFSKAYTAIEDLRQGIVLEYNPNTHCAAVQVWGTQSVWECPFADEPLSYAYGFSATYPAREGDLVLVLQIRRWTHAGVIIGRIGYPWCFTSQRPDAYKDPDGYHRRLYTQDDLQKRTWDVNVPGMMKALQNPNDCSTHILTNFRPTDVYPGEFAHVNQHNCGIKGGMFSATLLGGGASLRMSGLSNTARLTCEHYIRHSMHGTTHEFHNGRYLSSERNLALYQEERLGGDSPNAGVWKDDAEAPEGGENQTMRPRIKELSGFFGNLTAKFCLRPDPNEGSIRVLGESSPRDCGVSRETVDPSGQYRLSAAGMIAIERTGRIPVPARKCYPTDKDHEIKKDPEVLAPFEHDNEDPALRQLELFDRQAYDLKNQYARVDGLGDEGNADYDVPQEEDLEPLDDQYDKKFFGNSTVKLSKYDRRRAGMYIGEDGSVIIRDAWGSEIVMLGGNVQIACAGNVMILPGKTALTLAGDDIVQKAQNSIDVHASRHDVRISAARNLEMLGGGDEKEHQGGVIIESRGDGVYAWDGKGDDKGENVSLSGIAIRAKKQGVLIDGKRVNVRSREDTRIISGDKKIDGSVSICAKRVWAKAKTLFASCDDSVFALNNGSISAVAKSIGIYAENNLTLTKGGQYPVPIKWESIQNIASEYLPRLLEVTKTLEDEKEASFGFDYEALEKMVFSFRTSDQCGTNENWTIGAKGEFKMYEPAWVQVMELYETLAGIEKDAYKEESEWENGAPWPGKSADESAKYVQLVGLKPKNLTDEGFNASRKKVDKQSNVTETSLKEGYFVRKTQ